ncbi:PucR family transcriptional regulator [Amycolatopsis sp. YIM 10]|uniref:PucR family transcriptional regulator n=1 Tax=Amycolatopsis sp. YIM 10 TaxID=2653857 RepID=UPI0012A9D569|nr:PucR family transcriptional regulator [Amycolatopsis sp. YIM 10]QFU91385.1 Purine catabolism regulatory protein [Amycolatopsis sp. YIM 10]
MSRNSETFGTPVNIPLRAVVGNSELAVEVVRETLRPGALDLPVRWAHVCELRDPSPYLLGEELLLTAGVNLPSEQAEVDRYVRGLRAAGITALGFGITPPMHEELPETLRRACARAGLPLLVIGVRTPFIAVNRVVAVALAEATQREQRRITQAREALTRAAAGGLAELARELAKHVSGWVALVGKRDALAAEHEVPSPFPPELAGLFARLRGGSGIRSATTELPDGTFVVAQPVYPQATASHLVVVGRRERFEGTDRAIVAVGAALFGLASRAGSDTAGLGGAVTALVLAEHPPAAPLAELLGEGDYRVVAGMAHGAGPGDVAAGYDWLRTRLDTPLVELKPGPRFTAVVRTPPDARALEELLAAGWLVVVSAPHPVDRLPDTTAELAALEQRALVLGRPVLADGSGLAALVPPGHAADYAERTLAPLRALGDEGLLDTLRTWLAHHGGWDRTASALGVHRNSVRHRIARVERVLGVDLADAETRMELWFALRWADS